MTMKIIATAKHGVAIGLLYGLALTGLSAWADEPVTKEPEKASSSKPIEPPKAVEPKAADPKAPETKSPPSKAAEPPKESPKAADKTPEAKVPDAKISTPPAPSPKSADTKSAEPAKPPMPPIVAIKLALMSDPRLFPYEINVDMNGETATLSGKVGSEAEKTAALEIAQAVEGVKSVTNNLEIVKDLPTTLLRKKDEAITQYVKDRFGKSKTIESAHFDVKTEDGVVLLSGKTKFLVIALEAAEAARQVPGVKAVKSEGIRVESPE
jgi:hyperosmotically inducible protein